MLMTLDSKQNQTQNQAAAIEIENLVVAYGKKRAVDGLNLVVPKGAIFGFLGLNGAGKTTTIKTLLGFRGPTGGRASVLGYDVVTQNMEIRRRVGYVSEVNTLYDYLTIPQLKNFYRGTSAHWNEAVVDRYLKLFGLDTSLKVKQLSKGMKAQLALSLALGNDPDLLILDEPTSGLDPMARHVFLKTLVSEIAAEGKTVFFSSHILSEVETVADWVGIIRNGKLAVSDELDRLKQTRKILQLTYASVPDPAEIEALRQLEGVTSLEQEGRCLRLAVGGDIPAISQAVQSKTNQLKDLTVIDLNLEDIFLDYIKEA